MEEEEEQSDLSPSQLYVIYIISHSYNVDNCIMSLSLNFRWSG